MATLRWRDWWKAGKLPATEIHPEIHQEALVMVGCCEVEGCDHAWECQAQAWVGDEHGCNTFLFIDYCRACKAIRARKVAQASEETINAFKEIERNFPVSREQAMK